MALLVGIPFVLDQLGLAGSTETLLSLLRWPGLILGSLLFFALLYRYGPSRATPRWEWISPGSIMASLLWISGSVGFSAYVSHFGKYNETYGSLGAVAVLLLWLWLSAYVIVLGAELNAELEHQTARDTTTAPKKPLGERGAVVADKVAPTPQG